MSLTRDPRATDHLSTILELEGLTTEASDGSFGDLSQRTTPELIAAMNDENAKVPAVVAAASPSIAAAIDGIVERLRSGGRLIYVGAGTPGRIGVLDASECPPTFGVDPGMVVGIIAGGSQAIVGAVENAEDDPRAAHRDLAALGVNARDAVVGISASGRTPYVLGAIEFAEQRQAFTVGVASNVGSALAKAVNVPIEVVVGPELLAGSTRLKAGTAQKLVLNALSTIAMIRLGKTYDNLMVDLRITNEKLRARAERTVMIATGVDQVRAAAALEASDEHVKAAILMLMTGVSIDQAHHMLESSEGHLRVAIETTA